MNTSSQTPPVVSLASAKTSIDEQAQKSPALVDRGELLEQAAESVLERVVGIAKNVNTLNEIKLRNLRIAAGMSPSDEGERCEHQPERDAARIVSNMMHVWLAEYPNVWDIQALPGYERDYDLHAALRCRVRQAISRAWCS